MINNKRRNFIFKSTMLAASGVLTACGGGDPTLASAAGVDPVAPSDTKIAATMVTVPNGTALPNATFRLSGATSVRAAPYSLGYAFRRGDVPAGKAVTGDTGSIQVSPKNRWPDGSLKFAVLAGLADVTAGADTKIGLMIIPTPTTVSTTLKTAKLRATEIVAAIGCGAYGTVSWTGADWDTPFEAWVSGPLMSSWIYRKPVGTDKHLVAWLEVRLWSSGAVEVLPWIENGYLKVAGPTNKSATFTFTLGKTQRMSAAIDLKHHQRTPLVDGTALSYWLAAAPGVTPLHDAAYLQASELVPTYSAVVPSGGGRISLQATSFTPLQQGGFTYSGDSMASSGYQSAIGLLPEHDVLHLVADASDRVTTYGSVIRNGYSAGRYGLHYRDERTNRPPAFSSYSTLVFASGSGLKDAGASTTSSYTPVPTGGNGPSWDTAHSPSVGYMAYLLTGRFYFKEEAQFAAIANHFNVTDWVRGGGHSGYQPAAGYTGASGICVGAVQTRSAAWWFRSLTQALAVTPDSGDSLRAELLASVEDNCRYFHQVYVAQPNNPFGMIEGGEGSYGDIAGKFTVPVWQQDFITAAWGMALALGLPLSSSGASKMSAFFAWKAKSVVGRLGTATGWRYMNAAPYTMPIGAAAKADYFGGTGPWLTDFKAAYDIMVANYVNTGGAALSNTEGVLGMDFPAASQPSMWHNLQPALAYAVRHGVDGAQAAYDRMRSASNWSAIVNVFNAKPVWSVKPAGVIAAAPPVIAAPVEPEPLSGTPAWLAGKPLNEWFEIPGTRGADGTAVDAYSGFAIKQSTGELLIALAGGHNDSYDTRVSSISLFADVPSWKSPRRKESIGANLANYGQSYCLDGVTPSSRHTRYQCIYCPQNDRIMLIGTPGVYGPGGNSFPDSNGFSLATNTWDSPGTWVSTKNDSTCGTAIDDQGNIWCRSQKWLRASNTMVDLPTTYSGTSAFDPVRRQLFTMVLGDGQGYSLNVGFVAKTISEDLSLARTITFNPSAAWTEFQALNMAYCAMTYDPHKDVFYYYYGYGSNSGVVYVITPNAETVWDMSKIVHGAGSIVPASWPTAGIQNRFQYVHALRGIVMLTAKTSNLYFMRTS